MEKTATSTQLTESYVGIKGEEEYVDDVKTITDCLKHNAEKLGDSEAVVFAAYDGRERASISWNDVYKNSLKIAKSLIALGLRTQESVVINVQNCPEWIYITFGVILAGALPLGLNFKLTDGSDLLSAINQLSTCAMLVVDPGMTNTTLNIAKQLIDYYTSDGQAKSSKMPYLRYLIGHGILGTNMKQISDLLTEDHPEVDLPDIFENDIAILFATSGSTGSSKIVSHTHSSILAGRKLKDKGVFDEKYIYFNNDPFHWSGGFPVQLFYGQTRVTTPTFSLDNKDNVNILKRVIQEENCNVLLVWPVTISVMMEDMVDVPDKWPVEIIETSGQPLHKSLRSAIGRLCRVFVCTYGSTEVFLCTNTELSDPEMFKEFNCGALVKLNGLEIKIVNSNGETSSVNELGELMIRGPSVFKEYYNNKEKTRQAKDGNGWFKTDDLARINQHGELFIEGRISNVIISNADKIVPEVMEAVFKQCRGVRDVMIVPIPDPAFYQLIVACVVPENREVISEESIRRFAENVYITEEEIISLLPKFYLFLECFPKTNTGKNCRKKTQALAEQMIIQRAKVTEKNNPIANF